MPDYSPYFGSPLHALATGATVMQLSMDGWHAEPIMDADGNYTDRILLRRRGMDFIGVRSLIIRVESVNPTSD